MVRAIAVLETVDSHFSTTRMLQNQLDFEALPPDIKADGLRGVSRKGPRVHAFQAQRFRPLCPRSESLGAFSRQFTFSVRAIVRVAPPEVTPTVSVYVRAGVPGGCWGGGGGPEPPPPQAAKAIASSTTAANGANAGPNRRRACFASDARIAKAKASRSHGMTKRGAGSVGTWG